MKQNQFKLIAFPQEHGAYGFTLEPLLLSLLVAYSHSGAFLALGTLFAFFAHQPVKIFFSTRKELQNSAILMFLLYGIIALIFFSLFIRQNTLQTMLPFFTAILLMVFYLIMDILNYSRRLYIEILAPGAISLIAVSIALNANWSMMNSLGLCLLLAARFVPTPFYIRARLKLERTGFAKKSAATFSAGLAFLFIAWLAYIGAVPILGLVSVFILLLRTLLGLSAYRKKSTVKAIGMREFFYGLLLVILSAVGYWYSI